MVNHYQNPDDLDSMEIRKRPIAPTPMVTRRRWTEEEDEMVRAVAIRTLSSGIKPEEAGRRSYKARLRDLAKLLNRTYPAVRMRASRLGAYSYMAVAQTDIEDQINDDRH